MNKKIKKGLLCSVLCAVTAVTAVAGFNGLKNSTASAQTVWSNEQVTQEYFLGANFELPEAKLTIGDKTVEASVALVYPDGSATRAERVTLDQVGTYVLKYSAIVDGKPYGKEVRFDVQGGIVTYENEDTKIGYQTCKFASDTEKEYLTVSLAQNDKLTFSQLIDVADLTKADTLVNMFVSPSSLGTADFDHFYFMFTDAENPEIYLKVRMQRYLKWSGQIYFLSGGNGQELKGYEKGNPGKIHVNNEYGTPCTTMSFDGTHYSHSTGETSSVFVDEWNVSLHYDAATRSVYAGNVGKEPIFVMDQDSTVYYESLWTGFPSGRVSLSMWAENYNSANATFCLTAIRGIDLTAYGEKFAENTPPVITIDSEYEKMPDAKVGGKYPVATATAVDDYSGKCDVDVAVWYNYSSSNPILLDVVDGKFNVERKGYYTIIYTARDRYNNVATETRTVYAGNEIPAVEIELMTEPNTTAMLGDWVTVPTDLNITGGSGNKTIKISVSNATESYEITDGFRPETMGEWTVTYTATDYIGTEGTYSYTIQTQTPTAPTLVDELVAPMFFISGSPYTLPVLYANDYRTGTLQRALCTVDVIYGEESKTYTSGEKFTPVVKANGENVKLVYKYDGVILAECEIPTILAWMDEDGSTKLQEQNYFYGESITTEKTGEGIVVTAKSENAGWTFANSLVSEGFTLVLASEVGKANFSGYVLTLTDANDYNNVISMRLVKQGSVSLFSVDGTDKELEIQYDMNADASTTVTIGFENGCFEVNGTAIPVEKTVFGEAFEGFSIAKAYANVQLIDAQAGAAYRVVSINDNPFTGRTRDQIAPVITVLGDYGGTYAKDSLYTINAAVASDVLSPNVNFSMTVRNPDGKAVTDITGKLLENVDPTVTYTVVLSEYGQYMIEYKASEDKSFAPRPNEDPFYCGVTVIDKEAPTITFNGNFQTTAKVGDFLVIPNFTVSDNNSSIEALIVAKYVLNPNGALIKILGESNSIKAAYEGVYEFRVVVTDEAGNTKMIRAKVTVTK